MMSTRYNRVPQNDDSIDLESLGNYNYMTGVPNSPPPSFHSSQSIDGANDLTPTHTTPTGSAGDQRRSFLPPPPSVIGSTTDSEAVVLNLHKRIERLEETIGRLLMEKELSDVNSHNPNQKRDGNCCVSFSNSEPTATELAAISGGGNCCVTFGPRKSQRTEKDQRILRLVAVIFGVLIFVMIWTIILAAIKARAIGRMEPAGAGEDMDGS